MALSHDDYTALERDTSSRLWDKTERRNGAQPPLGW